MRKADAIKKAAAAGYTIKYDECATELRFRKPGAAMNAVNQPDMYMSVFRLKGRWFIEEKRTDKIL